jgi:3',5'-nucleoside bisphosphate phosphatase
MITIRLRWALEGLLTFCLTVPLSLLAQTRSRTDLPFPHLPEYLCLKCDFHMHTVFSDGQVWPSLRAEEAWREGLDAIAITDHIEYTPHTNDMLVRHGRSIQLATNLAAALDLLLVPAAEITRKEPPGHWNALFLTNLAALDVTNYFQAVSNAAAQGAFIFWNHPSWKQPDRKGVWYQEQQQVYEQGQLHGLEIVNGDEYDPIVHQWCLDRKLTLLGCSDSHIPVLMEYEFRKGEHRPMTLVFARARSLQAIREALQDRRTAVWSGDALYGDAAWLTPLFDRSLRLSTPQTYLRNKGSVLAHVRNQSPVSFHLQQSTKPLGISVPKRLTLAAGKTVLLEVRNGTNDFAGPTELVLPYLVTNLLTAPDNPLPVELKLTLTFEQQKKTVPRAKDEAAK